MGRLSDDKKKELLGDSQEVTLQQVLDAKKTTTDYTGDISDPKYLASWFEEDAQELLGNGTVKTVDEAIKISEANIRSIFEATLKQGKTQAIAQLNKTKK